MAKQSEIRYLTPLSVDVKKKKYCRFKKNGIKYIDYKDPEFLKKFFKNPVHLNITFNQKAEKKQNNTLDKGVHNILNVFEGDIVQ